MFKVIGFGARRLICRTVFAGIIAVAGTLTVPTQSSANSKYAGIVIDHKTGRVLYADNADKTRFPASLTKVMTLYIAFEEIEAGRLSYDTRMKVSSYAASRPPSKIYVKPGGTLRVKDAIGALITKSANDASVVLAEHISGSEKAFAKRMTQTARALGMKRTTFRNANGLPNSKQVTTARDMATLGRAIQDRFPEKFKWFKTRRYKVGSKTYGNHNRLLGSVSGVDGIKTGYIRASGFNLLTSVNRDGRRVVAVVMGGRSGRSRDAHMADLISRYFKKAKRGKRTAPLVASRKTQSFATAYAAPRASTVPKPVARPAQVAAASLANGLTPPAALPTNGRPLPLPTFRPKTAERTQVASAAAAMPVPSSRIDIAMAVAAGATAREALAPLPPANIETVPVSRVTGEQARSQPISLTQTAQAERTTPAPSTTAGTGSTILEGAPSGGGWVIQIGAMPNRSEAVTLLKKAMSKGGPVVGSATPFVEQAVVKKKTFHRARFAGFLGKSDAQKACKTLEKKNFACFATQS